MLWERQFESAVDIEGMPSINYRQTSINMTDSVLKEDISIKNLFPSSFKTGYTYIFSKKNTPNK